MSAKKRIDSMMEDIVMSDELKENIMNKTVRRNEKKVFHMHSFHRVAVAVLAMAMLCGSITAVAAGVFGKWNSEVADSFNASKEEQNKLSKQGYAQDMESQNSKKDVLTATDNGITFTVKQTLVDKRAMYIYLDVKSTKGVKLDTTTVGFRENLDISGLDYENINGGFVRTKKNSDYHMGYFIHMVSSKKDGYDVNGKTIGVHFKDLISDDIKTEEKPKTLAKGEWNLSWTIKGCNDSMTIPLNKTIKYGGATMQLKQLELSPLSFKLDYYLDNYKMKEDEFINKPIYVAFKMKDGTIYNKPSEETTDDEMLGGPGSESLNEKIEAFDKVLDIDNLQSVIVCGEEFSVGK